MEEKQNAHVERQHAQIDQLENDFKNRQQEADEKLRFLLEEKTKLERQFTQQQEDLEINKEDHNRIREALEEENRYLLVEREKQQVRLFISEFPRFPKITLQVHVCSEWESSILRENFHF